MGPKLPKVFGMVGCGRSAESKPPQEDTAQPAKEWPYDCDPRNANSELSQEQRDANNSTKPQQVELRFH